MFLDGDLQLAKKLLEPAPEKTMRRIDIAELFFYVGGMAPLLLITIIGWLFKPDGAENPPEYLAR